MSTHVTISQTEAADRLAIRDLVEAYAHCADRRDAKGQMSLFTSDTHFVVHMNAKDPTPSMELHSRKALAPVFADLNKYDATTHFVGQSTISTLSSDRATGEAYCLAHHVTVDGSKRRLMVASLRYLDTFVKTDGTWLFSERLLYVDWVDESVSSLCVSGAFARISAISPPGIAPTADCRPSDVNGGTRMVASESFAVVSVATRSLTSMARRFKAVQQRQMAIGHEGRGVAPPSRQACAQPCSHQPIRTAPSMTMANRT